MFLQSWLHMRSTAKTCWLFWYVLTLWKRYKWHELFMAKKWTAMNSHCELKMPQHKPPEPGASQICVSVHIDQLNIAHVDPSSKNRCAKQDGHLGDPEPRFDGMKDWAAMRNHQCIMWQCVAIKCVLPYFHWNIWNMVGHLQRRMHTCNTIVDKHRQTMSAQILWVCSCKNEQSHLKLLVNFKTSEHHAGSLHTLWGIIPI